MSIRPRRPHRQKHLSPNSGVNTIAGRVAVASAIMAGYVVDLLGVPIARGLP
jgi:hypothetical protein